MQNFSLRTQNFVYKLIHARVTFDCSMKDSVVSYCMKLNLDDIPQSFVQEILKHLFGFHVTLVVYIFLPRMKVNESH